MVLGLAIRDTEGVGMRHCDAVNLAWDVADAVAPALPKSRRTAIFAALGAGAVHEVLPSLVTECALARATITSSLAARVLVWIDNYAEPRDRCTLRAKLKHITGLRVMPQIRAPLRLVATRPHFLALVRSDPQGPTVHRPQTAP